MKKPATLDVPSLPPTGFVRLRDIYAPSGGALAILHVSRAEIWRGIKEGRYPKPTYLTPVSPCWRVEELLAVIDGLTSTGSAKPRRPGAR